MTVPSGSSAAPQQIRFCTAPDGVRIAYAVHGTGPPLVISTCWLSHLQHDWQSPVWRHFLADIGRVATIVRYDERGFGLSDWDAEDLGLEARVGDLAAVVAAAGYDRFALMAMAQGGPVSIAYAARHPERITRLVFYNSYASGLADTAAERQLNEAFNQMVRVGWARPRSEFRRVFTSMMIPSATEEQMRWLDELQRVSVSAETLVRAREARVQVDCRPLLPELDLPTLVLQSRGDQMNDFETSIELTAGIGGARLVPLESDNHIVLAHEPAWAAFRDEVTAFLAPDREVWAVAAAGVGVEALSPREVDVLRLAADGLDNDEIAARLSLSVRTVERHLQNAYGKLGVSGRSARAAAVARLVAPA